MLTQSVAAQLALQDRIIYGALAVAGVLVFIIWQICRRHPDRRPERTLPPLAPDYDRILREHRPSENLYNADSAHCLKCGQPWPCQTVALHHMNDDPDPGDDPRQRKPFNRQDDPGKGWF